METQVSSSPAGGPKTLVDAKLWELFDKFFSKAQKILDENRILIGEINQNHESKTPENLTRNVALIRQLNSNIAQVVDLYSDLSSSFVKYVDSQADEEESRECGVKGEVDRGAKCVIETSAGLKRGRST